MITISQYITESIKSNVVYHCSPIQNMAALTSDYSITNPEGKSDTNYIYATVKPITCSAFGFQWNDSMGIDFGSVSHNHGNPIYTFKIPKQIISLMKKPCSMYTVDASSFIPVKGGLSGEVRSKQKRIKVLSEKKYKSTEQYMKSFGVKIKII